MKHLPTFASPLSELWIQTKARSGTFYFIDTELGANLRKGPHFFSSWAHCEYAGQLFAAASKDEAYSEAFALEPWQGSPVGLETGDLLQYARLSGENLLGLLLCAHRIYNSERIYIDIFHSIPLTLREARRRLDQLRADQTSARTRLEALSEQMTEEGRAVLSQSDEGFQALIQDEMRWVHIFEKRPEGESGLPAWVRPVVGKIAEALGWTGFVFEPTAEQIQALREIDARQRVQSLAEFETLIGTEVLARSLRAEPKVTVALRGLEAMALPHLEMRAVPAYYIGEAKVLLMQLAIRGAQTAFEEGQRITIERSGVRLVFRVEQSDPRALTFIAEGPEAPQRDNLVRFDVADR